MRQGKHLRSCSNETLNLRAELIYNLCIHIIHYLYRGFLKFHQVKFLKTEGDLFLINKFAQERMKVREVIPHIGPIPIVIPLKLFLEGIDFLVDNVTSRVTCLSPFSILQRLITIIHFHKRNCFSRYFRRISKKYT